MDFIERHIQRFYRVVQKPFILFNVVLIGIFAYGIIKLHLAMGNREGSTQDISDYTFADIARPDIKASGQYDSIFGIKRPEPEPVVEDKTDNADTGKLNQLVTIDEIIRVMGIFISEDRRNAVLMIIPKNDVKAGKTQKISQGEMIRDYSVVSITPGSIVLSHPASGIIHLKIFKPRVFQRQVGTS